MSIGTKCTMCSKPALLIADGKAWCVTHYTAYEQDYIETQRARDERNARNRQRGHDSEKAKL
jgi:hypothetical protein